MSTRMRLWSGILAISLAVALGLVISTVQASKAAGGIIYVDADAAGAGNGSAWADAFTDLQPALEAAQSGDQLWVAAGTYIPSLESDPSDPRSASFQMKNGVAIYGGFAGAETELAQRDWVGNPTILSGDIGAVGEAADNCYHVFYHPSGIALNSSAVLDGFTITAGNADSTTLPHLYGGGMHNETSSPTLTHVTFSSNSAFYGGGMSNDGSSPTLTDITFSGNSASHDGGGMYNSSTASPVLIDCTFTGNLSAESGGGMFNTASSPTLTDCTFSANAASAFGGGMYNHSYASPTLTGCVFTRNSASNAGAMYNLDRSSPVLTDCIFTGNTAIHGGGFLNDSFSSPQLTNCIFVGNRASDLGGGMVNVFSSSPILTTCTFTVNSAVRYGGAIYNYYVAPTLVNLILWGDTPNELYDEYSQPLVTYSDIQGGYAGDGNIDLDPGFVRPPTSGADGIWGSADDDPGDLRLQPASPVIDAGNNAAVPAGILFDLSGASRFVDILAIPDTGLGIPPLVDMGAYEVQITILLPLVWR